MTAMLDPGWTPQRGYSHADGLLAILARNLARKDLTPPAAPTTPCMSQPKEEAK